MKYILLDTNIYIDMIVSRNSSHKPHSFDHMMKLLNHGEIRVIVPNIIITEVKRHLRKEIEKIEVHLKNAKKATKNLYWINASEEIQSFENKLSDINGELDDLIRLMDNNKQTHIDYYVAKFEELFAHPKTLTIVENQQIIYEAMRRNLYKIRPFHYEDGSKDSLADAVIIETILDFIDSHTLNENDSIYFISRNYKDFSDENDRASFHRDIQESIDAKKSPVGLFYREHFTKTLLEDFSSETSNAELQEELEKELKREIDAEFEILQYHRDEIDQNRSYGGLDPLNSDWEQKISEEPEIEELLGLITTIKNELIAKYGEVEEQSLTDNELWECKDYFKIDQENIFSFEDFEHNIYQLVCNGELDPREDDSDIVDLTIYKNEEIYKQGSISVYYGWLQFDEEGHPDGALQKIDVELSDIKEALFEIKSNIFEQILSLE